MTAQRPTSTFAPSRRLAVIAVALPLVLWQQMPFGGCLCSDGHFKLFCAAGLFESDGTRSQRAGSRVDRSGVAPQPKCTRACCRTAKTHRGQGRVARLESGHHLAAVCDAPCRCSAIARSREAVLSRSAEKGPELKAFDLLAFAVPSATDLGQTATGVCAASEAPFRNAPDTIALCRLVI